VRRRQQRLGLGLEWKRRQTIPRVEAKPTKAWIWIWSRGRKSVGAGNAHSHGKNQIRGGRWTRRRLVGVPRHTPTLAPRASPPCASYLTTSAPQHLSACLYIYISIQPTPNSSGQPPLPSRLTTHSPTQSLSPTPHQHTTSTAKTPLTCPPSSHRHYATLPSDARRRTPCALPPTSLPPGRSVGQQGTARRRGGVRS
jgi:hypothetical protein